MQGIGVDVSKIAPKDTILKLVGKTLKEPEEILIQRIKEMGLKPDDNIGSKISTIKVVYNKSQRGEDTGGRTIATEEQVKRLKEMGVWEKNTIDEFIEKLEKVQGIGVDVSKIVQRDTILKLVGKTLKEQEEILIQRIKGIGLKPDDKIGKKIIDIKSNYKKSQKGEKAEGIAPTEAQVEKIRSFGIKIGKEITGQSIGQASYTATTIECDEAQANLDRLIQEERTKEGEREQND